MNFARAFKFPYENGAKVITIVLVLTIAFTACIALIASSHDWSSYLQVIGYREALESIEQLDAPGAGAIYGLIGLMIVMVLEGFWLSGYSADVVRAVVNGNDTLPAIKFGANLRKGFWLFLSSLFYLVVAVLVMVILYFAASIFAQMAGFLGLIATIAAVVFGVCFVCLAGWGYFVGMARYAIGGQRGALFQMSRNIGIARQNVSTSIWLTVFLIILVIIYNIARSLVDGLFGGLLGGDIVVAAAITFISYYAFNLFQHFSSQHLIAQYALAVVIESDDFGQQKDKVD